VVDPIVRNWDLIPETENGNRNRRDHRPWIVPPPSSRRRSRQDVVLGQPAVHLVCITGLLLHPARRRWVVERTFAWLNQSRRLRVRYEKRADIHEAFLSLGCALICWSLGIRRHQSSIT
jgi:Transposase DDE domain